MGALTACVSQKGISDLVRNFAAAEIGKVVAAMPIPDKSFSAGKVPSTKIDSITVNVSGGSITNVAVSTSSATQQTGGRFAISLTMSMDLQYNSWSESGQEAEFDPGTGDSWDQPFSNDCGIFTISVGALVLNTTVALAASGGVLQVTLSGTTLTCSNVKAAIPDSSMLESAWRCVQGRINDAINDQVASAIEDMSSNAESALQSVLSSIPNSGHLTPDISYLFTFESITFPNDQAVAVSIAGDVQYQQIKYSSFMPIPSLAAPDNIAESDVHFFIGDFEFNGLLWAFYQQGSLAILVTPSMLPDPSYLNTSYYRILLPALYKFAPNCPMHIAVAATAAPTVADTAVYELSRSALAGIQSQISAAAYRALSEDMVDNAFATLQDFDAELAEVLTSGDFTSYHTIIESAAATIGSCVLSSWKLSVYVEPSSGQQLAFDFTVTKNDVLNQFVVQGGNVQTLQFVFSEIGTTTFSMGQNNVPGLSSNDVMFAWFIVNNYVDQQLQKIGQTGVAIPSISGVGFQNSTISLNQGYVSLVTDASYHPSTLPGVNLAAAARTRPETPSLERDKPIDLSTAPRRRRRARAARRRARGPGGRAPRA